MAESVEKAGGFPISGDYLDSATRRAQRNANKRKQQRLYVCEGDIDGQTIDVPDDDDNYIDDDNVDDPNDVFSPLYRVPESALTNPHNMFLLPKHQRRVDGETTYVPPPEIATERERLQRLQQVRSDADRLRCERGTTILVDKSFSTSRRERSEIASALGALDEAAKRDDARHIARTVTKLLEEAEKKIDARLNEAAALIAKMRGLREATAHICEFSELLTQHADEWNNN
jgi:hypothetical protein